MVQVEKKQRILTGSQGSLSDTVLTVQWSDEPMIPLQSAFHPRLSSSIVGNAESQKHMEGSQGYQKDYI